MLVTGQAATINAVTDPVESMSFETFMTALSGGILSEQEIADWIRSNRVSSSQKLELTRAIGPVTGVIRTALRELDGLAPVPGDEV
jgi:hypothetical protein